MTGLDSNTNEMTTPAPGFNRQEPTLFARLMLLTRRYAALVIGAALLGAVAAMIANAFAHRTYTATAEIELTEDKSNEFRLENSSSGIPSVGTSQIETEIAILKSARLAFETIQVLHLQENPKFSPLPPGGHLDMSKSRDRQNVEGQFISDLAVTRLGRTNLLDISFTTGDPDLSAEICNQLISTYKTDNFQDNFTATQEVSHWLEAQLSGLRGNLDEEQAKLVQLQRSIGVVGLDSNQTVALARLSELNAAATTAQTSRLVQEARLTALQSSGPGVVDALANDPILNQLTLRKGELDTQVAAASATYGTANPRLAALLTQQREISSAIATEEGNVLARARKELSADQQNEKNLNDELSSEKASLYAGNSAVLTYALARQQYEGDRSLYEGLQQRLQEAGIIAGLHSSAIRRVATAEPPLNPSSPRKRFNLALGIMSGLILGGLVALLLELLDTKVRTVQDLELTAGVPLLGLIPRVPSEDLPPAAFIAATATESGASWSPLAEAYRGLRSSILLSRAGGPPKVILVSSARPAEGKTSVASLQAIVLAISGARVLLIDADLRRPTVHTRFGFSNLVGLTSVLSSSADVAASLQSVPSLPSLQVLTSGPIPPMPSELLASPRMTALLEQSRSEYDFIVIDTPPILAVTDASALFTHVNGVLLVVRSGLATKRSVEHAVDVMLRLGAPLMGAVLNSVDAKSSEYSDYYSAGYYSATKGA